MAVDEASRHHLFNRLEEVLGREDAAVLMSSLPPVGMDQLVTRSDLVLVRTKLDLLRQDVDRVRLDIERLREDVERQIDSSRNATLAEIRRDISNQTRTIVVSLVAVVVSMSSVALFR
jgi:hypothetical protein